MAIGTTYNGEHSVTFSGRPDDAARNTWENYRLIPAERPMFDPPEMSYINWLEYSTPDVIGFDFNLSKRGIPVSRKASWTFYSYHYMTEYNSISQHPSVAGDVIDPDFLYQRLMQELHGKVWTIRFSDESHHYDYHYKGLVEVTGWKTNDHFSEVTIEVTAEPYKFGSEYTTDWDYPTSLDFDVTLNTQFITPIELFIIPKYDIRTLTMQYCAVDMYTNEYKDIVISSLSAGHEISVDGIRKKVLDNGVNKMPQTNLWAFPSVKKHTNSVHRFHFVVEGVSNHGTPLDDGVYGPESMAYVRFNYRPRFL